MRGSVLNLDHYLTSVKVKGKAIQDSVDIGQLKIVTKNIPYFNIKFLPGHNLDSKAIERIGNDTVKHKVIIL